MLPKRIEARLREESERTGVPEEELVVEALSRFLGEPLDPEARAEVHLKLSEKYMREAEELLARGDYAQASEKAWGAAAQAVKALAARRGVALRSHGELHREVMRVVEETGDDEVRLLWHSAVSLHQNFYENWLPPEMVERGFEDVKKLVGKLKHLLSG
uniref:HEPN domain-containing protein n=1 Tax=Thermofilum pendens TaxID=2269 RepID=A0A7J3X5B5_THEPE